MGTVSDAEAEVGATIGVGISECHDPAARSVTADTRRIGARAFSVFECDINITRRRNDQVSGNSYLVGKDRRAKSPGQSDATIAFIALWIRGAGSLTRAARREHNHQTRISESHRGHPVCGKLGVIRNALP
jgi:hypothetical protein